MSFIPFLLSGLLLIFSAELSWAQGLRVLTTEESQLVKELNRPRRIVLAIGINSFSDPFWNQLQFADSDATNIYRFLREEANLPFDAGELITSQTSADRRVTRENLIKAFERLKALNLREDDTVVVYLSTHGTIYYRKSRKPDEPSSYIPYFVASDTSHRDIQDTAISRDELLEMFQALRSQRKALIIATCHSGGGKAQLTADIQAAMKQLKGMPDPLQIPIAGKGFSILSASSWSEAAAENPSLRQDVYTHFLLEGMRKGNGRAHTLTQAHDYATRNTIAFTKKMQNPTLQMDQSGGDPIVLSGEVESKGLAFLYSSINMLKNYELKLGGQSKGILGESYLTMPEGKHRLEIVDPASGKVVVSRVVRLSAGKEYSVSDLIQKRRSTYAMVAMGPGYVFDRSVRAAVAPKLTTLTSLAVRWDESIGIWDLHIQASYSPWQSETVRIDDQPFPQKRSTAKLLMALGAREVSQLVAREDGWRGEWGFYAGPLFQRINRRIVGADRESTESPNASVLLAGLGAGSGFTWIQDQSGFALGIHAQYDMYSNAGQIDRARAVVAQGQISASVGVGW